MINYSPHYLKQSADQLKTINYKLTYLLEIQ